jgi:hypothetical protein
MTYVQRRRSRLAGGRQLFWNPLAGRLIVFLLVIAIVLVAISGIEHADCAGKLFVGGC